VRFSELGIPRRKFGASERPHQGLMVTTSGLDERFAYREVPYSIRGSEINQ